MDKENKEKEEETEKIGEEGKWKVWREKSTIQPEIDASNTTEAPLQTTIQSKPSYPIPMSNNSEGAPPIQVGPLTNLYEGSSGGSQGWGVAPPGGSIMTPQAPDPSPPPQNQDSEQSGLGDEKVPPPPSLPEGRSPQTSPDKPAAKIEKKMIKLVPPKPD